MVATVTAFVWHLEGYTKRYNEECLILQQIHSGGLPIPYSILRSYTEKSCKGNLKFFGSDLSVLMAFFSIQFFDYSSCPSPLLGCHSWQDVLHHCQADKFVTVTNNNDIYNPFCHALVQASSMNEATQVSHSPQLSWHCIDLQPHCCACGTYYMFANYIRVMAGVSCNLSIYVWL